ncbi:MAG: alanine--tRNA ligase [Candidatus Babeliaceae bacterium]
MKSLEIRHKFFDFFTKNRHTQVSSSSLIPAQDPTLLFTNAGMNQFKDVFLGKETRSYKRAVSIQKCMRAGGKHNDLENVGFTKRHLTFFEMMGNFSFGDYFKEGAITYAWEFLTKELRISPDTLYASVFEKDQEAYDLWHKIIGLPENRIVRLGAADNFWQMGETGPCGPCSEIYIDRGSTIGCQSAGCGPGCHCDRFLEIWNLVFMQFDRQPDGTDKLLAQTGVDTGMGLERLCTIMQNTDSVFETDLFTDIIKVTEKLTQKSYHDADSLQQAAFRVIADHIRSSCFALADGCTPSNEGRGYVLRKIIRRAALFAQKLSDDNFFPEVAYVLIQQMGALYPELKTQEKLIVSILRSETEKFSHNLLSGQAILQKYMQEAPDKTITGQQAFKLYDTYGFPLELTKVIAQEHHFSVDLQGFEKYMNEQRLQSGKKVSAPSIALDPTLMTEFTGYTELETETVITALLRDQASVAEVAPHEQCWIITPKSPFYVEGGGQVSDQGWVVIHNEKVPIQKLKKINNVVAVEIIAPDTVKVGDQVTLQVNKSARIDTMKNHTATHLLQSALIQVLGKTVKQAGSLVAPDYLRFDFTYHETLTAEQIKQIEQLVNDVIMENIPLRITQTTYKDALARGVIAFFGEKYNPEKVRVVEVPGVSAELCGGTHVKATGDIGCFKITEVSALSAGNRRIVALTGPKAFALFQDDFDIIKTLSQEYKVKPEQLIETLHKQREQCRAALLEVKNLKKELLKTQYSIWLQKQETIADMPFLYVELTDVDVQELREVAQNLIHIKAGIYFLISQTADRLSFVCMISPDSAQHIDVQAFYTYLKQEGLSGGLSGLTMQGGMKLLPSDLKSKIKNWLNKNLKRT